MLYAGFKEKYSLGMLLHRNLICALMVLGLPLGQVLADSVKTSKVDGTWITEATVDTQDWEAQAASAIMDLANYSQWAFKGINGKDPRSARYWEQLTAFRYQPPGLMTLVYNINLDWPLGSKGNTLRFSVDAAALSRGEILLKSLDTPIIMESAQLSLSLRAGPQDNTHKYISIKLSMRLAWIIDSLLEAKSYSAHINEVLGTISSNLARYCRDQQNLTATQGTAKIERIQP